MRKSSFLLSLALSLPVAVAAGVPLQAQQRHEGGGDGWCNDYHYDRSRVMVCEVREETLPADRDVIAVDGRANGGITVTGWDRNEILVEARVSAWGRTEDDAEPGTELGWMSQPQTEAYTLPFPTTTQPISRPVL